MGILYRITMEAKRNHIIQELLEKGVTHSVEGKSVYELDYDELKQELVLAVFRQIDRNNDSGKWF